MYSEFSENTYAVAEDIIPAEIPAEPVTEETSAAYAPMTSRTGNEVTYEVDVTPADESESSHESEKVATVVETPIVVSEPEVTVEVNSTPIHRSQISVRSRYFVCLARLQAKPFIAPLPSLRACARVAEGETLPCRVEKYGGLDTQQ